MPRPSDINHLLFVKCPDDPENNLRNTLYKFAEDYELVGDLINRAVKAKLGSRRQIRNAIKYGAKTKGSKFRLEQP